LSELAHSAPADFKAQSDEIVQFVTDEVLLKVSPSMDEVSTMLKSRVPLTRT
jgi:hypothetical protein